MNVPCRAAIAAVLALAMAAPAAADDDLLIEPLTPEAQPLDFGMPLIGTTSQKHFVATNRTTEALTLNPPTVDSGNAQFGHFDTDYAACPQLGASPGLAPGASCTFTVLWVPFAVGPVTQPLAFTVNFDTDPAVWNGIVPALDARGGGHSIAVGPERLAFATTDVGTIGAASAITVRTEVPGFLPRPDIRIRVQGPHRDDFLVARDGCTGVLLGDSCEAALRFAPSAEGARRATVVITDEETGDVRTVQLSGGGAVRAAQPGAVAPVPPAGVAALVPPAVVGSIPSPAGAPDATVRRLSVRCRTAAARRRVCTVTFPPGASAVRYRVLRRGKVVRRGRLTRRRPRITLPRGARAGQYVLRLQAESAVVRRRV